LYKAINWIKISSNNILSIFYFAAIKQKYNQIIPGDFEYYEKLGEGGFGAVVRCKKISTGKVYAMKIQRKVDLVAAYRSNPTRIDLEVRVLASLHHRFLTEMDYSFQTENFAMVVMELAEGGTLESVQSFYKNKKIPEETLRFYLAEITDAVHHIHRIGLIYRDMKGANVLLDHNGHIKLADLGGVIDTTKGKTISPVSGKTNALFPFAPKFGHSIPFESATNLTHPRRQRSIMGTPGYMAPEMVALFEHSSSSYGYCYMVDWWSFGVMIYALITNKLPFTGDGTDYDALLSPIVFPVSISISSELKALINKFLTVEESQRLGFGLNGFDNIREDKFFSGIDWDLVANGTLKPPLRPGVDFPSRAGGNKKYSGFDRMITVCMEENVDYLDVLTEKKQSWFKNW
jgi:serine/threonine protein kinase